MVSTGKRDQSSSPTNYLFYTRFGFHSIIARGLPLYKDFSPYLLRKFVPTEFSVPDSLLISVPDLLLLVLALIFLSESFL